VWLRCCGLTFALLPTACLARYGGASCVRTQMAPTPRVAKGLCGRIAQEQHRLAQGQQARLSALVGGLSQRCVLVCDNGGGGCENGGGGWCGCVAVGLPSLCCLQRASLGMVVLLVSVHKRDLLHRWRRGCVPGLPTRQFVRSRGTEPSRVHRWVAGSVSMCVEGGRRGGGHRCVAGKF
jgi:hypothetical protein